MEKQKKLQDILTDLENKKIFKHEAEDLICVLFGVSKPLRDGWYMCKKCNTVQECLNADKCLRK